MASALLDLGIAFFALAVAGAVAARVGLSVIPLYLVAGIAVGPHVSGVLGLPAVEAGEAVTALAELGIVFLLFFLGLEFSLDRLVAARTQVVKAGSIDLLNLVVGVALGVALGWSVVEALLLGGIVYISSSAIVTKSLIDFEWIADPESEPVLGTLVFEDLVVAGYLAVVSSLVLGGDGVGAVVRQVAIALAFLGALFLAVRYGTSTLESVLNVGANELFVIRILGMTVPIAAVALSLGVSEAVAAFFVGMGVAATPHHERVERLMTPVRDALAAVFFLWVGLGTDPRVVGAVGGLLAILVAVTVPTKLVTGYYGGRSYGLSPRRSIRAGLALLARGEFSLVIAAAAVAGSGPVQTTVIPAVAVGYVLATSTLGTVLMQRADAVEAVLLRYVGE